MPEFVMRHHKLPGQPIIVNAESADFLQSGESPQEAAGWRLSPKDPSEIPEPPTNTDPPTASPDSPTKKKD